MAGVLMSIGEIKFVIGETSYDEFALRISFDWSSLKRLQNSPKQRFDGIGDETFRLHGEIFRENVDDTMAIYRNIKAAGAKGISYVMVDGRGNNLGLWCILELDLGGDYIDQDSMPKHVKFSVLLRRSDG